MIFFRKKKNGFWGILGPPSYGIGATIRIGREMLCLPYAGFFSNVETEVNIQEEDSFKDYFFQLKPIRCDSILKNSEKKHW